MELMIEKLFMTLLIWILRFLDGLFDFFKILAGIKPYGDDSKQTLVEYFLESDVVTQVFFGILIVSVVVCAICVITAVVKNMINLKGGETKSHAKTAGQGVLALFIPIAMAVVMLTGIAMSNFILVYIDKSFNTKANITVSEQILDMSVEGVFETERKEVYKTNEKGDFLDKDDNIIDLSDPDADSKKVQLKDSNGELMWELVIKEVDGEPVYKDKGWLNGNTIEDVSIKTLTADQFFGTYKKTLGLFEDEAKPKSQALVAPSSFNFLVAYICAVVMVVVTAFALLGLVKRLYDLVLLFLALPLVVSAMPLDDGAAFKRWRETVISKVILAYGCVFSFNLFLIMCPLIMNLKFTTSLLAPSIFKLFLLIGGGLCVNGGQLLFSRLIGSSADESREMTQSARALVAGAMVGGGLLKGAKNLAVGGANKYGRQTGGILGGIKAGAKGAAIGGAGAMAGGSYLGAMGGNAKSAAFHDKMMTALKGQNYVGDVAPRIAQNKKVAHERQELAQTMGKRDAAKFVKQAEKINKPKKIIEGYGLLGNKKNKKK